MTFSTPVCLFSLLHERSKKNFDRKQVCPITLSIKRPLRVAALFLLTTIGLKSIYWVSLKGGMFGTIFFIKKAQNISLSCFCKHGTERNDRQTNKQTKERLESRLQTASLWTISWIFTNWLNRFPNSHVRLEWFFNLSMKFFMRDYSMFHMVVQINKSRK